MVWLTSFARPEVLGAHSHSYGPGQEARNTGHNRRQPQLPRRICRARVLKNCGKALMGDGLHPLRDPGRKLAPLLYPS